ncbi:cytochrome P450 [Sorangium sp. So ce341]|uniref:cytochrome P450 n=1 Tax=Sorangium sp. So ce341 TaxID=3133302 RepID=UPI003F5F8A92
MLALSGRPRSSVPAWRRRATRPVELGGAQIPEGAKLLVVTGSASHDGAVFSDAERFDIHRKDADRHLAFGHGRHFCLGAPLARMELRVFLEEVTRRLPHLELTPGQDFRYVANTSFRGPEHVWVQLDPAKNPVPGDRSPSEPGTGRRGRGAVKLLEDPRGEAGRRPPRRGACHSARWDLV